MEYLLSHRYCAGSPTPHLPTPNLCTNSTFALIVINNFMKQEAIFADDSLMSEMIPSCLKLNSIFSLA